jgi:hypothetical protein
MSKHRLEQPEIEVRPVCCRQRFEKFLDSHVAAGHQIRMCLDPNGNFSLFSVLRAIPRWQTDSRPVTEEILKAGSALCRAHARCRPHG